MTTVVAIHQPNFFPWLGYFDKIRRSDIFVVLDHVQSQKTGGTWTNRVKMLIAGDAKWVTAPLDRSFSGVRTIREEEFPKDIPWRERLLKTVQANYARSAFFRETMKHLEPLIWNRESRLADYNLHAIRALCSSIGLETAGFIRSSTLGVPGKGTALLSALVQRLGGSSYLCGGGANGYQDDEIFSSAGVQVIYQNYSSPQYFQAGTPKFVPGLSIVDALMNLGADGTRELLCMGRSAP